jgi:hypothetical protein
LGPGTWRAGGRTAPRAAVVLGPPMTRAVELDQRAGRKHLVTPTPGPHSSVGMGARSGRQVRSDHRVMAGDATSARPYCVLLAVVPRFHGAMLLSVVSK